MGNEFEYYRVHRKNDNTIPLLDSDEDCPIYLSQKEPIENPKLMLFQFGDPVPKNPRMADYHSSPHSVISKKIYDVLSPLDIYGIQLLPARIRGNDDEEFSNYWAIHIYNKIKCVDAALSDCVIKTIRLFKVKKLVFDKQILGSIPLNKRLIFRLGEDSSYQIFHKSIVDSIMSVNPEGIKFTNIEDWTDGSFFN